jgi:hypothetical protein
MFDCGVETTAVGAADIETARSDSTVAERKFVCIVDWVARDWSCDSLVWRREM